MKFWLLPLLILAANASAATSGTGTETRCESSAPDLLVMGDDYYNLERETPVSRQDAQILTRLYQKLEGRWSGEQSDSHCVGAGESLRIKNRLYLLKNARGKIRHNGLFSIKSEKELVLTKNYRRHETRSVDPDHRNDFHPADGLMTIKVIDPDTIQMTRRYRRSRVSSDGDRFSQLRERQDSLSLIGRKLLIKTDWYSNGYYTGTEITRLTRR